MAVNESDLSVDEASALNARPKFIAGDVDWKEQPSDSHLRVASFLVLDENKVTIPGLTVELLYVKPFEPGECKYLMTLFTLRGTSKRRSFQVEVVPAETIKHRARGIPIPGPHQHIAEPAFQVDTEARNLTCADYVEWFQYFLAKINASHDGKFFEPNPPDPQGKLPI